MRSRAWSSSGAGRLLGAWGASLTLLCGPLPVAAAEPLAESPAEPPVRSEPEWVVVPEPEATTVAHPITSSPDDAPSREGGSDESMPRADAAGSSVPVENAPVLIDAGQPVEGARRLSDAYLAMPSARRVADEGRRLVVQASEAFVRGGGAAPEPAVLESERALLTAYFADLGEARAAGRPTAAFDAQEQWLAERLAAVERELASRSGMPGDDGRVESPTNKRERVMARLLLGAGATGTIGGGVMVIVGAAAASRAERIRAGVPQEDAGDARRAKAAGSLMATFGALIFSGSIMMLGVGSARLRELREGASLAVVPTRRGFALSGRF